MISKKLNDDLQAAMDEVNTQSKQFFKKFGTAKEMLAKVQTDADALKATIPAKIEAAKKRRSTGPDGRQGCARRVQGAA